MFFFCFLFFFRLFMAQKIKSDDSGLKQKKNGLKNQELENFLVVQLQLGLFQWRRLINKIISTPVIYNDDHMLNMPRELCRRRDKSHCCVQIFTSIIVAIIVGLFQMATFFC